MARRGADAEEVRERREADPPQPPFEQPSCECRRAQRWLRQPPALANQQLTLEEALVEPRVVRNEQVLAGEGEEAGEHLPHRRRATKLVGAQPGESLDRARQRDSRVDERL